MIKEDKRCRCNGDYIDQNCLKSVYGSCLLQSFKDFNSKDDGTKAKAREFIFSGDCENYCELCNIDYKAIIEQAKHGEIMLRVFRRRVAASAKR